MFLMTLLLTVAPLRAQAPTGSLVLLTADEDAAVADLRVTLDEFTRQTGIAVTVTQTDDVTAALTDATDLALVSGPTDLAALAAAGVIVPLINADGSPALIDHFALADNFAPTLMNIGLVDRVVYGVPVRLSAPPVVWYQPPLLRVMQVEPPATWADLIDLQNQLKADGRIPWALPGDDAALLAWFEALYVRAADAADYPRLFSGDLAWTDQSVVQTFELFGQVATPARRNLVDGRFSPDLDAALSAVYLPDPPAALLFGGSEVRARLERRFPSRAIFDDYSFFPLPPLVDDQTAPVVTQVTYAVALRETPAVEQAVRWLASTESATLWASTGGMIAPQQYVPIPVYDSWPEYAAYTFAAADTIIPAAGTTGQRAAVAAALRAYVANPADLPAILADLDAAVRS